MTKSVLQEYTVPALSCGKVSLEEGTDAVGNKVKNLYMEGLFLQGNTKNHNGRVYPDFEIRRAVDAMKSQLEAGSICGELDHPADLQINLDRVSHMITDMWMDGANGIGKLKILPTPMGQIAKNIIESGVKLGVSSRGQGNVDDFTGRVSDYEIVTVDIVATPSGPNCYPVPIYESTMNMKYGHKLFEAAREVNGNKAAQKFVTSEVLRLIQELKL